VAENTKNKILNAAESVALRDGVAHLTLDAVAAEAGFSKGGVLYNFPGKEALVRGMVERLIAQTEHEVARLAELDPEPHGRTLRAYLTVTFPENGTCPARVNQVAAVLLSAILTNPDLLEPARVHFHGMQQRLMADGLDERTVHIIRLAADGLWLSEMLSMPGPKGAARTAMIHRLHEMTRK
jgi:AcrR family transcriptional regulator